MASIRVAAAAVISLCLAACAVETQDAKSAITGSLKPRSDSAARSAPKSADETKKAFCAQRHIDYQSGKAPGGAKTLEQKQADDRLCEAIGRQG